MLIFIKRMQLI